MFLLSENVLPVKTEDNIYKIQELVSLFTASVSKHVDELLTTI